MKKITKLAVLAVSGALAISLSACGDDETTTQSPAVTVEETTVAETTPEDATTDDATADDTAGEQTSATEESTDDNTAAPAGEMDDLTTTALQAVKTAEAEVGGEAYELDDQDRDGTWEVDVMTADGAFEVKVADDGVTVVDVENEDMDADERAALENSAISLVEAVEKAHAEFGGVLDDVELEEEDGRWYWEISFEGRDDVYVNLSDGGIVG